MRWNKQYDGTKESPIPKSHKPILRILTLIQNRNSSGSEIITGEIPTSLYASSTVIKGPKKAYKPKPYDTPVSIGAK